MLKLTMKIIALPIAIPLIVTLTLVHALIGFVLFLSGKILAILSFIFGVGGLLVIFVSGNTFSGVVLLVMAFLISPFGLPAIVAGLAGLLDGLNDCIKGIIRG